MSRGARGRLACGRRARVYPAAVRPATGEALARALRILQQATAGVEGGGYFGALARGLAEAFAMESALVAELDPARPGRVLPLVFWDRGRTVELAPYELRGTPCAGVGDGTPCQYADGVWRRFPDDALLVERQVESYVGLPIVGAGGDVLGILAAFDREARPDVVHIEAILAAFASRAGWTIERARFERRLQREAARAHALARVASGLHAARRQTDALQAACVAVRDALEVSAVSVVLVDEATGELQRRAQVGLPAAWLAERPTLRLDQLDDELRREGARVFHRDRIAAGPTAFYRESGLTAVALAPLRSDGRRVGYMTAVNFGEAPPLSAEDIAWLDAAAGIVGQAVVAERLVEALRASEQRHRRIVTTMFEGVATVDAERRITFANQRLADLLGRRVEEMLGVDHEAFVEPEVRPWLRARFEALRGGRSDRFELRLLRPDGTPLHALVSASPLTDDDGGFLGALATVQDITELRRLETRMVHAQKLESLGVLAGGVAHDFSNLLVGILGNVALAQHELPPGAPAAALLRDVETAAVRASDLTAQMLTYAGKGRLAAEPVDLGALVAEMLHLLTVVISRRATLRTEFAPDLPEIAGDPTQIRQVVMNLITNASDALGDADGVITLRTEVIEATRALLASTYVDEDLPPGRYVCLTVADTGCGMDAATQARIFDPFFTTKFAGRGLGLAAVLGILRGHGGAIQVESAPGRGSRFRVLLPIARAPAAARAPTQDAAVRGPAVILVADDEAAVRTVACRVLERAGYRVIVAGDGRAAVDLFAARADEIDAVLLDLTMPRLRGDEALRELRRIRPGVRAILSSGFSDQGVAAGAGFLPKPWTPQDLLAAVRRALAAG
jgi:PAS domain S-box-containing protein